MTIESVIVFAIESSTSGQGSLYMRKSLYMIVMLNSELIAYLYICYGIFQIHFFCSFFTINKWILKKK